MIKTKYKLERGTTPAGIAVWPRLTTPDTKFDEAGVYSTKLRLEGEDAEKFMQFVDERMAQSMEKAMSEQGKKRLKQADSPYKPEFDEDDNETGATLFNFKLKAIVKNKNTNETFEQHPVLFDSQGGKLDPRGVEIWAGSKIKVGFQVIPFFTTMVGAGVSLRLRAVQVIDLVSRNEANAEAYGFGQENGYVAGPEKNGLGDVSAGDADSDEEDEDF